VFKMTGQLTMPPLRHLLPGMQKHSPITYIHVGATRTRGSYKFNSSSIPRTWISLLKWTEAVYNASETIRASQFPVGIQTI
jgi:hypothetical protein